MRRATYYENILSSTKPDRTSQKAGPKIKKAECKIKYKKFSLSSSYVWDQYFSHPKFRPVVPVLKFHFSWYLNSSAAPWQSLSYLYLLLVRLRLGDVLGPKSEKVPEKLEFNRDH